jgi:hypothetical protein
MYFDCMNTATLTIRLPQSQRSTLRKAAGALKKTESEYVRDLISRDLVNSTFAERLGDLAGSLRSGSASPAKAHPLKERIRSANWRS